MKTGTTFRNHKLIALAIAFLLTFSVALSPVKAQDDSKFNMDVSLNSDQFFGFYPFVAGSYNLNPGLDFTFYSILWSGGTGGGWGNWSEFGVGLSFAAGDILSITPQVGILNGNLLSSGTAGPSIFGDGIVPNLTVGLDSDKMEGELYFGYYLPLRDEAPEFVSPGVPGTTLSYIHYWTNLGYKASSFFSLGIHWEHLINSGGSNVDSSSDVYQWFGPYVQFADPGGKGWARFAFGTDVMEDNDSFFKMTVGMSF